VDALAKHPQLLRLIALALVLSLAGCSADGDLQGEIKIDGSSTVYLIFETMGIEFHKLHPGVSTALDISGTGGGFQRLAAGETEIVGASRPIHAAERERCRAMGIDYLELQIGYDGIAVIIHPENTWASRLTVAQLRKIWHPNTKDFRNATLWSDVDPAWPHEKVDLYGPGWDSGTFDLFTEAVNGREKLSRSDFAGSENDYNIINGVVRNKYALGYLGVAYFKAFNHQLRTVAIAREPGGPYERPTTETIRNRRYQPLSRPLFLYVTTTSLHRPEVRAFVVFLLRRGDLVRQVGYVPLRPDEQQQEQAKLERALQSAGD
jgi:phosphate transport system substrate-binding protein